MDTRSAYELALDELGAAEREAERLKSPEALHRVIVARSRATALYQRPDSGAPRDDVPTGRVWIGNRAP